VQVCAYDRANIGRSDAAPTPRTAQDVVDDLDTLLDTVGAQSPYVLVGFSFGGIFTQLYAAEHPDEISGLVLIESNHPDEARQFEQHLTRAQIAADRAAAQSNPEGIDIYASFAQVKRAGPLPSVPLVVVTATTGAEWPPGWDPAFFDRLRARQQADLATLVPGGQQIFAKDSSHDVPADRPDVVINAIDQVLN
jgi:pimeloyl-ACP methyl ester carboxylesterase